MQAFVICKNEEPNIGRCVRSLQEAGFEVSLLDSGSTDATVDIARRLGAEIRTHEYENHCTTYNRITNEIATADRCVIVDADMLVSRELAAQAGAALDEGAAVVLAPVTMVWAGYRLEHASLYPPKAFAFRTGSAYFLPHGHGEQLDPGACTATVAAALVHDDRKPYQRFLSSQVRYGRMLQERLRRGDVSWKDRVRAGTPLAIFAQPLVSYVLRAGFLDGRGGLIYALDRMIAEAIAFREVLASDASPSSNESPPASSED